MNDPTIPVFAIGPDDHALALLERLRNALLMHPRAGVALFDALVAEGQHYAATPEGDALVRRLADSPLLARLEQVFDFATLGVLTETRHATGSLTSLVDAVFELALRDDSWQMAAEIRKRRE
ncbi:MAG: hypothetical protein PVH91_00810 [Pseudomonadales bacterium]|jgi:hypothetical protein